MNTTKTLGIWMDHATAHLIELDGSINHTIESGFTHTKKVDAMHRSEDVMHNKEQQLNKAYYKQLAEEIQKYNRVLLFGPTSAKTELHNYLVSNLHFKNIRIDIEQADKMTDPEKFAFVKKHYERGEPIGLRHF